MLNILKRKTDQMRHSIYAYKDLDEYRKIQTEGNKAKINKVWADKDNIDYLARFVGSAEFGICHGTRRGLEQKWFSEALGCQVIGTEISETATDFPNTIQWDFHNDNPTWHGTADFIYSNSFDHAYDPESALRNWMKCLKPTGVCMIEHSSMHEGSTKLDPFGATIQIMPYLILTWGKGEFAATEILDLPVKKKDKLAYHKAIAIRPLMKLS